MSVPVEPLGNDHESVDEADRQWLTELFTFHTCPTCGQHTPTKLDLPSENDDYPTRQATS